MIGIIDTSSLLAIVRYYLSIKDEAKLLRFLEFKFRYGELILLSSIHGEVSKTQKGIILSRMTFLNDKELLTNDTEMLPPAPKKFSNQLDNNFSIPLQKKLLTEELYAQQKDAYMQTGDVKMILYALNNKSLKPIIITEETPQSNDGKLFKKLPVICDFLEIDHISISEWLSSNGVKLSWTHP